MRRLLKKVGLLSKGVDSSYEEYVYTKQIPKKAVLLVSLPYGDSYNAMKAALGLKLPEPPFIDWQSNIKTNIPPLDSLPTSIRHFALCIVPLEDWDDPTKSLSQKFHNGRVWELVGPNVRDKEGEGVSWKEEKIERIDGMVEIGVVEHGDVYISEEYKCQAMEWRLMLTLLMLFSVYRPLKDAWGKYQVVGWNSWDFSIRLAYLLRYSVPTKAKIAEIRRRIDRLRVREVFQSGHGAPNKWVVRVQCGIYITGAVGVLTPWLNPSTSLRGLASLAWTTVCDSFRSEPYYMVEWENKSKQLETRIPQLQGLLEEESASDKGKDPISVAAGVPN